MKLNPLFITVSMAAFLAGCTTVNTTPGTPAQPASPPPTSGRTIPDSMAAEASLAAVQHFNIRVTASGAGPVEAVRQAVEGKLADEGYKISDEAPDIIVNLTVRSSEFDRSGDYVRYEGSVDVGVSSAWEETKLGFEPFKVRGRRGLGEDEAMRNLSAQLAEPVAPFVIHAARPELSRLAVNDIVIKRPPTSTRDAAYPANFISSLRSQPGVVYCSMVAEDYASRIMTFRVVYQADAFPEGLMNRITAQTALNLKPRN